MLDNLSIGVLRRLADDRQPGFDEEDAGDVSCVEADATRVWSELSPEALAPAPLARWDESESEPIFFGSWC